MNFIKNNIKDSLYILVILILVFLYLFKPSKNQEVSNLKNEIKVLEQSIKNKQLSLDSLDKELKKSDIIKQDLENKYLSNKPKYVKITKELYIKDSIVNTFDVTQLEQFFTDRFNKSKN